MRSTWTDSRLDDLKAQVGELKGQVSELDKRMTGRMDALQHTIMLVGGGLFAAFVAVLAAIIGLIATQI